jgi:uncharacterized glyoxalase superfamily protein PhnB
MSDAKATFDALNLVARDVNATLDFYRLLGLDIPETLVWKTETGAHHVDLPMSVSEVGLDVDSEALASAYNESWQPGDAGPGRTLIGFNLPSREDVDARYAELTAAGHPGLQPPYDAFWGARYAIVQDPDGRHVGMMSPADPERRTAPPGI